MSNVSQTGRGNRTVYNPSICACQPLYELRMSAIQLNNRSTVKLQGKNQDASYVKFNCNWSVVLRSMADLGFP